MKTLITALKATAIVTACVVALALELAGCKGTGIAVAGTGIAAILFFCVK